jgi:cyclohexa-1,5-dienecarbonyl-CoA hydratase
MSPALRLERDDRVAHLTLDRPPLNILDLKALAELRDVLTALAGSAPPQLLVLRGGERAFSAGVAVQDHTPDKIDAMLETFHAGLATLLDFPAPTIAVIRGPCLGGGMELAAACDMRLCTGDSTFGQPEIELGCYPPWAAAHYPELLGHATATELLLTGRTLTAGEALLCGFVQQVVGENALEAALESLVGRITGKSAAVTRLAVRALRARRGRSFERALAESERLYTEELTRTHDMNEGLAAFLEKRPPEWSHR